MPAAVGLGDTRGGYAACADLAKREIWPTFPSVQTEAPTACKAFKPKAAGFGNEGPPGSISKSEAVRRALADGVDPPADGAAYIQSQFGIEMGPQHFSAVKSAHLKKPGPPTVNTRFQKAVPANSDAALIDSLETLKPLAAVLGAEKVKRLIDWLG